MDSVDNSLIQTSYRPANSGHPVHRGTPREVFIKTFLQGHLSANVAIGTGEIIDANSQPRGPRNQFDIVIYKNNYPKLDFQGGINGFMIESVIATIEVKSVLDQSAINQSVSAAHTAKRLIPNLTSSFTTGWIPPRILNFVVAYQGPAQMKTVHSWILNAHAAQNIPLPAWSQENRITTPATALDGVFLLQKGFVKLDNAPMTLNSQQTLLPGTHIVCDSDSGNLLMLFLALQEACNNIQGAWLNPIPYLHSATYPNVLKI